MQTRIDSGFDFYIQKGRIKSLILNLENSKKYNIRSKVINIKICFVADLIQTPLPLLKATVKFCEFLNCELVVIFFLSNHMVRR